VLRPDGRDFVTVLENRAHAEGEAWADRYIEELTREGRTIRGGWPGTKSEARRITVTRVCQSQPSMDRDELQGLSTTLYLSAKRHWLARTTPNRENG